jgi:hypothetical protein
MIEINRMNGFSISSWKTRGIILEAILLELPYLFTFDKNTYEKDDFKTISAYNKKLSCQVTVLLLDNTLKVIHVLLRAMHLFNV